MSPGKTGKTSSSKALRKRKDRVSEIANTLEWLITAFMLAFVFRAFVMEAFRIPTGSMADTLKGAHFRLRCPQCGYKYEHGFVPQSYGLPQDTIPPGSVPLPRTRCPSCGHYLPSGGAVPVANGDRILVLKCIYQFREPRRWDVIVFKNPLDPSENYIKRLIGLPGEEVRIIDGDIYINGKISRKPARVQEELWMPVYNNDYQPVRPREGLFNSRSWQQPFKNVADSKWRIDEDNPTKFCLDSSVGKKNTLVYDASIGNNFRATYAYDDIRQYRYMPYCSDLMVRFYIQPTESQGHIGIALSRYETNYKAWVDLRGEMVIAKISEGEEKILDSKPIELSAMDKSTMIKFANVDHQLIFQFGEEILTCDLGHTPDAIGQSNADAPQVEIFGSGKLTLSHIAVFRDIHYTAQNPQTGRFGRATEDNPFTLGKDEFFVLGDNSPNSEDGRWWSEPNKVTKGCLPPRQGVVPRDYLVGKALFVYWPSGFEFPWPKELKASLLNKSRRNLLMRIIHGIVSLRWIPNVGQMRFIYGGSDSKLVNHEGTPALQQPRHISKKVAKTANDKL